MFETVASLNVPYVLMHKKGSPKDMQKDPQYDDVVKEVLSYFSGRVYKLRKLGVADIILDPGFGFGKNLYHNYTLLNNLDIFHTLACPILAGISRKSMINKVLHTKPENALNGTTVAHTLAVLNGASILRVHDVKAAKEVFKIVNFYREPV
jgi:dihydropteroate synthase